MVSLKLILGAIVSLCENGLPALLFPFRSNTTQRLTTFLVTAGFLPGLCGTGLIVTIGNKVSLQLKWKLPSGQFFVVNGSVLDRAIIHFFCFAGHYLPMISVYQKGQTKTYVLCILVIIILLLILGI